MNELMLYLAVFIGAALPLLEVWIAVPLGVIAGLPWLPAALIGTLGNVLSLLPILYAGEKITTWNKQRKKAATEHDEAVTSPHKRRIIDNFSLPGLALLGPFLLGVHAAMVLAIASGASKRNALLWFSASILICSLSFSVLADMGFTRFVSNHSLPFSD